MASSLRAFDWLVEDLPYVALFLDASKRIPANLPLPLVPKTYCFSVMSPYIAPSRKAIFEPPTTSST